jgi:hypothetical protein
MKSKQERIVFRSVIEHGRNIIDDNYTTVSFIPVCDNCNYVLHEVSGKVGDPFVEPCVCPRCHKIIKSVRLPIIDVNGKLDYED